MEILGYLAASLIGISLGLIGGGGSILTVPVLVYLFNINAVQATSYSLFIVGSTSLVGAWRNYRKDLVNVRVALLFGASSITTVYIIRKFIIQLIPSNIATIGDFAITKSLVTMVLFAVLMLLASISMIWGNQKQNTADATEATKLPIVRLLLSGISIGLVTGLLGAGGGFLLIPTLVLLLNMSMKEAVGTSLLIIALNSLIGFTGDIGGAPINWSFLLMIAGIGIAGILAGSWMSKWIPGNKLKTGFGWFVLIMGIYILIKEIFL